MKPSAWRTWRKPSTMLARVSVLFSLLLAASSVSASWDKQSIKQMVAEEAARQNFSVPLALAVAEVESNFDPNARSHVDARGVMQILPKTAEEDLGVRASSLYNPRVNIRAGVRFLMHLISVYGGRVDIALSHYNGGSRVRQSDGSLRVIPATRGYVDKVLHKARQYGFDGLDNSYRNTPVTRLAHGTTHQRSERRPEREALDDFENGDPLLRARSASAQPVRVRQAEPDSREELINKLQTLVIYNQNRVLHDRAGYREDNWTGNNYAQDRQMGLANEW